MSIVKDMSLAESGRRKIQWVRDFMPALSQIEARFLQEKPFQGLRVAVSVHLEAKTANLGYVLKQGGAEVYLTGSNRGPQVPPPHRHRRRGGSHRPAGGQVRGIRRLPAGGVRGDHHRHPPPKSPGEGRPAPLPHGSGKRRQGQALL